MSEVETVLHTGATIGESPTWSHEEGALYWIDVKAPALYRYDPRTGGQRRWPVSADFGGFALYPDQQAALEIGNDSRASINKIKADFRRMFGADYPGENGKGSNTKAKCKNSRIAQLRN